MEIGAIVASVVTFRISVRLRQIPFHTLRGWASGISRARAPAIRHAPGRWKRAPLPGWETCPPNAGDAGGRAPRRRNRVLAELAAGVPVSRRDALCAVCYAHFAGNLTEI